MSHTPARLLLLTERDGASEVVLLTVGLLVELDALGNVLEASTEWQQDAVAIRARMLRILSLVASRYLSAGRTCQSFFLSYVCCISFLITGTKVVWRQVIMTGVVDSQLNISCQD